MVSLVLGARTSWQRRSFNAWLLARQVSKTAQTGNLGFDKIMAMYRCEVETDSEPSAVMAIGTGFSHVSLKGAIRSNSIGNFPLSLPRISPQLIRRLTLPLTVPKPKDFLFGRA